MRYLFAILSECFNIVPDFTLIGSTPEQKNFFKELGDLPQKDSISSVTIFTCDSLLRANDWPTTWSSLLSSHTTVDSLLADMTHRFDLKIKEDNSNDGKDGKDTKGPTGLTEGEGDRSNKTEKGETERCQAEDDADDDDLQEKEQNVWTPTLVNNFVVSPETLASGSKVLDSPEMESSEIERHFRDFCSEV